MDLTDEQLIERLQQGHTGALDELYRRYARRLYAFCQTLVRASGAHDAGDLVQDVFLRVIKGAHTFDPEKAAFRTWVFRIARNRCIDVGRRERLVRFLPIGRREEREAGATDLVAEEDLVDEGEDVARTVARASSVEAVRDCIDALENEDEKQAIVLYYLGGKVYREIGEILGKSTSMARKRVQAAQVKVKRCLEGKGVEPHL